MSQMLKSRVNIPPIQKVVLSSLLSVLRLFIIDLFLTFEIGADNDFSVLKVGQVLRSSKKSSYPFSRFLIPLDILIYLLRYLSDFHA